MALAVNAPLAHLALLVPLDAMDAPPLQAVLAVPEPWDAMDGPLARLVMVVPIAQAPLELVPLDPVAHAPMAVDLVVLADPADTKAAKLVHVPAKVAPAALAGIAVELPVSRDPTAARRLRAVLTAGALAVLAPDSAALPARGHPARELCSPASRQALLALPWARAPLVASARPRIKSRARSSTRPSRTSTR